MAIKMPVMTGLHWNMQRFELVMEKIMASILDSVDQRTQLVGENRLELLLFRLQRGSLFALNVFKIHNT